MTDNERKLRAALDALQTVVRDWKYEIEANFLADDHAEIPPSWQMLLDASEILGNWDPDDELPEDGYAISFTFEEVPA
jgi:hypothetical protein